ncbi:MAG: MoaD/ThiS family protein [Bacilli bacterium]
MIKVKLFAYFRDGRGKELDFEYRENLTILDIANELEIKEELLAITLINGKRYSLDTVVEDGKTVFLFPPVGGG